MNTVDETMFDLGCAPVAAPDKPAAVCKLSEETEITLPARLSPDYPDYVARQAVMMNAHGSKFCGAVVKQCLLAGLAAIGFVDHDFNSHLPGGGSYVLNQLAHRWFEQRRVGDAL